MAKTTTKIKQVFFSITFSIFIHCRVRVTASLPPTPVKKAGFVTPFAISTVEVTLLVQENLILMGVLDLPTVYHMESHVTQKLLTQGKRLLYQQYTQCIHFLSQNKDSVSLIDWKYVDNV